MKIVNPTFHIKHKIFHLASSEKGSCKNEDFAMQAGKTKTFDFHA